MVHDPTYPTPPPDDQTLLSDPPARSLRQRLALLLGQLLAWNWLRHRSSDEQSEGDAGTEKQG